MVAVIDHGRIVAQGTPAELERSLADTPNSSCRADRTARCGDVLPNTTRQRSADLQVPGDGSVASLRQVLDKFTTLADVASLHTPTRRRVFRRHRATRRKRRPRAEALPGEHVANTLTDSATMLRRNPKHQRRYPSLTLMLAGFPIVFLLLFIYASVVNSAPDSTCRGHARWAQRIPHHVVPELIATVASAALAPRSRSRAI
jgi:hypothetical protein